MKRKARSKERGVDRQARSQGRWTKEARDAASRAARKLTDAQELEMVRLVTSQNGPRISELARLFGLSPAGTKKLLVRRMGKEAAWAATHARLSEGMRGNKHGVGRQFPKEVAVRWGKERRGEGNPNWKGGAEARHRLEYKDLVSVALARDAYRCIRCRSSEQLVVHHVVSEIENPELLLELSNLETLCRACHARHHHHKK